MESVVLLVLILICPFIGFVINRWIGNKLGFVSGIIATFTVVVSFVISLFFFFQVKTTGQAIQVHLFDWISFSNFTVNFDFKLDQLSLLWLLLVTGVGALIHIYSIGYMKNDKNIGHFFAYLNLFIFFMSILVASGNLLVMFIGWEGVGLCSYLLIGFWYTNQNFNNAAKKAFIMNRIGDLGFLIGICILGYMFKSVDFDHIQFALSSSAHALNIPLLGLAAFALFVGAMGKSAQIPLFTWLPDAMAGPTPVSALIHAATMVTAGIFMVTRMHFLFDLTPKVQYFIAIIGAITSLFAASIGMTQNDIKKVLAYSTISQLGLMFLALGTGAYSVAVFHVLTHAFFKACLFLGSGSVIHGMNGEQDMRKMGGLRRMMPLTFATFLVAALSLSGIPPFAGFFSKDQILMSAFSHHLWLWIIASLACLMTAFYIFRALYLTFGKQFRGTQEEKKHIHESSWLMVIPLLILALLALIGGFIGMPGTLNALNKYLMPVFGQSVSSLHPLATHEYILMLVSVIIAIVGIGIASLRYIARNKVPNQDEQITGVTRIVYKKYFVDEIYSATFVKLVFVLSMVFGRFIENFINAILHFFVWIVDKLSHPLRKVQTGNVGFYLICFVVCFCVLIICLFLV